MIRNFIDAEDIMKLKLTLNRVGESLSDDVITDLLSGLTEQRDWENYFHSECGGDIDCFLSLLFDELGIEVEVSEEDLAKLPSEGSFATFSNHPYGVLDKLIVLSVVRKVRKDFKCISGELIGNPHWMESMVAPAGVLFADAHTESGVGCFFANEQSFILKSDKQRKAEELRETELLTLSITQKTLVVPIGIAVTNMLRFYVESALYAKLHKHNLPAEWNNKKNRVIRLRIGNVITMEQLNEYDTVKELKEYLKVKLNRMILPLAEIKTMNETTIESAEPITAPVPTEILVKEIEEVGHGEGFLFEIKNYAVYCLPSFRIPNILNEIGRLREVTFRAVGEGTNKSIDLDGFDMYYHHLFIWDTEERVIVGAYRIGKGKEIMDEYGLKGFYINTLFKIKRDMMPTLYQALELGRSFVVSEYQRKPLSLFLLWKGLLYFVLKHPDYRYMIGPVTISGRYNELSKDLIVRFINKFYWNREGADLISPRCPYKPIKGDEEASILLRDMDGDLSKFDKLIEDIEPSGDKLPILLKKYLSLNGKIIGFNVDPDFNMCLDGLLLVDLFDIPLKTVISLAKEVQDATILKRFNNIEE
ncbi:MAG: lysophospholipid acyltransferase family protein [Marinifilaceae bacterium]